MKGHTRRLSVGHVLLIFVLLASGASAQTPSGFLSDYSRLSPAADMPDTSIWISKDFDFKPYRKIMLDKVEVFVSPTSEYHGASPDVLKGMADRFTASFKKALQSGYQLVDKPGPDVLRIRPALSGINLVKPNFNLTNVIPVIFVARGLTGANQTMNVALTGELEVRAPDDSVVAQSMSIGTGDASVRPGREITWREVEQTTDKWAQDLRRRLDEARGVRPQRRS